MVSLDHVGVEKDGRKIYALNAMNHTYKMSVNLTGTLQDLAHMLLCLEFDIKSAKQAVVKEHGGGAIPWK